MNDNQMKPLQALKLIMTRLQPSKDNVEKAKVEYETVKSALKEYELMKQTKFIVADKKISDDDLEKLKNQRMFVGSLEQCEIKPLFDEETTKKLKALEIIKEEFLNRGDFIFRFEYTSDAMLVIEEWIMDNKINEMKIPFNRNYYDLLKEVLKND